MKRSRFLEACHEHGFRRGVRAGYKSKRTVGEVLILIVKLIIGIGIFYSAFKDGMKRSFKRKFSW